MITIILFVSIGILFVFLLKRLVSIAIGILIFFAITFISLFIVDNYTTIDLKSFLPIAFYDDTVENPQETAEKIKDKSYEVGEGAIERITEKGNETDYRYGTETEKQKEQRLQAEQKEKEQANDDSLSLDDALNEKPKENNQLDVSKKQFIPYKDSEKILKENYKDLTEDDIEKIKTIVPNLIITIEIENKYKVWNEKKEPSGFYIEKLKEEK